MAEIEIERAICGVVSGGITSIPYIVSQFGDIIGYTRRLGQVLRAVESTQQQLGSDGLLTRTAPLIRPTSLITVSSLSLTCPCDDGSSSVRTLISDVSFVVASGRGVLITGPTGSGKVPTFFSSVWFVFVARLSLVNQSSLLRAIAGLWKPASGNIQVNGSVMFVPQKSYMTQVNVSCDVTSCHSVHFGRIIFRDHCVGHAARPAVVSQLVATNLGLGDA
jgi:ABC-type uncharacterized transport system fused permease/ATPase subunit